MRKIISFVLSPAILFSFVACGTPATVQTDEKLPQQSSNRAKDTASAQNTAKPDSKVPGHYAYDESQYGR